MNVMKRGWVGVVVAFLGWTLAGCGGDDAHGACLYDTSYGLVCYQNASASCCQQINGEFHSGESCSKYGGKVEPASYSGCH